VSLLKDENNEGGWGEKWRGNIRRLWDKLVFAPRNRITKYLNPSRTLVVRDSNRVYLDTDKIDDDTSQRCCRWWCLTVFMLSVLPVVVLHHHILRVLLGLTIRHNHCGSNCTLSFRTPCINRVPYCRWLLIKEKGAFTENELKWKKKGIVTMIRILR
jgi:hypothetical protein